MDAADLLIKEFNGTIVYDAPDLSDDIPEITFSSNWNRKLNCEYFTTIRLHNQAKYRKGRRYRIMERKREVGLAVAIDVKHIRMDQLTEWHSRLDAGMCLDDFRGMLFKMYKNRVRNIHDATFDFVLLEMV